MVPSPLNFNAPQAGRTRKNIECYENLFDSGFNKDRKQV